MKFIQSLSPVIAKSIFSFRGNNCNLKNLRNSCSGNKIYLTLGNEITMYRGSHIWNLLLSRKKLKKGGPCLKGSAKHISICRFYLEIIIATDLCAIRQPHESTKCQ